MSISNTPSQEHFEKLVHLTATKPFLGREFLTWVWFEAESGNDHVKHHGRSVQFWVDDKVVLESPQSKVHTNTLRGGHPSQSAEAAAALLSGKSVKEMKIGLRVDDVGEFTATLAGHDLTPRSLKLPIIPGSKNDPSVLELRLEQAQLFLNVLDQLFKQFMDERTKKSWEDEKVEAIRTWIQSRQGRQSTLH